MYYSIFNFKISIYVFKNVSYQLNTILNYEKETLIYTYLII